MPRSGYLQPTRSTSSNVRYSSIEPPGRSDGGGTDPPDCSRRSSGTRRSVALTRARSRKPRGRRRVQRRGARTGNAPPWQKTAADHHGERRWLSTIYRRWQLVGVSNSIGQIPSWTVRTLWTLFLGRRLVRSYKGLLEIGVLTVLTVHSQCHGATAKACCHWKLRWAINPRQRRPGGEVKW